jgi:hypothetical protein
MGTEEMLASVMAVVQPPPAAIWERIPDRVGAGGPVVVPSIKARSYDAEYVGDPDASSVMARPDGK